VCEAQLNESAFFGVLWLYFEVEQKDKLLADKSLGEAGKGRTAAMTISPRSCTM